MKPILIVYGTVEGHTQKIAQFIAGILREDGFEVVLTESANSNAIDAGKYSAVIAGAPVHISRYPESFVQFIAHNAKSLCTLPSAFFSVCLGILQSDEPETIQAEQTFAANLFLTTGWQPTKWTIFAGALMYSKYGWIKKHLLHLMLKMGGRKTDTDRDYQFTDWDDVRKFTSEFGSIVRAGTIA